MFEEKEYLSKIRTFLESYPNINNWGKVSVSPINFLEISNDKFENTNQPQGTAIIIVGGNSASRNDITGVKYRDYQIDLLLALRRLVEADSSRRDLGDLLINFRMWIDYCQDRRLTNPHPLLPMFGDIPEKEIIRCNGGVQTAAGITNPQNFKIDEYSLQINIHFQKIIIEEEPF